jgi:hypothetical protein
MEHCELVPGRGIRRDSTDIFFGMPRKKLRDALGWKAGGENMWDDEDEYSSPEGNDWLRLRFLDDKLCDIEVMGGHLIHEGIELVATDLPALRAALKNLAWRWRKHSGCPKDTTASIFRSSSLLAKTLATSVTRSNG